MKIAHDSCQRVHWTATPPAPEFPLSLISFCIAFYWFLIWLLCWRSLLTFFLFIFSCFFLFFFGCLSSKALSWQCNANWKGYLMAKLIIDECRHAPQPSLPACYAPCLSFLLLLFALNFFTARFYLLLTTAVAFVCMWVCVCMRVCACMCVCV